MLKSIWNIHLQELAVGVGTKQSEEDRGSGVSYFRKIIPESSQKNESVVRLKSKVVIRFFIKTTAAKFRREFKSFGTVLEL